ncbi:MAG TPA: DUF3618 domain-containing protein [Jiangellaceae bacterium]|nr:DUF3618 domain-containing protein [Jiangellaceae bacterium]
MSEPEPVLPASRRPMPGSSTPDLSAEALTGSSPEPPSPQRTADEIEQELEETTDRLAARIDALVDRVSPAAIMGRGRASVRRAVMTPNGRPRAEFIGALIGGLIGVAVLVWRARQRD